MRYFSIVLLLMAFLNCAGCESFTRPVTQSLNRAADDYHRVTTGSNSSYIASHGQHP